MKNINWKIVSILALILLDLRCAPSVQARGGFGGGGGFHGGVSRGDYGMRSDAFRDFDHGFDHPGYGRSDEGDLAREDRPDAFSSPGEYSRGAAQDNGIRNYGVQRNLASDGGFGSVMRSAAMTPRSVQTSRVTPASLAGQGRQVRDHFNDYNLFRRDWWDNHPGAWWNRDWNDYWAWGWGYWPELADYWGCSAGVLPVYYDYGDNISYDSNGYVNYGGQPVASASDYYQQSYDLANSAQNDDFGDSASGGNPVPEGPAAGSAPASPTSARKSKQAEWKPFGVYSLVQGGQSSSSTIFQLCTNKDGKIRGNYYNALTNDTQPVKGSIDKRTMRASWTVGKNQTVVYDTGVANLLKDDSPVLIHFSRENTQQWTLVRIKNPGEGNSKNKA